MTGLSAGEKMSFVTLPACDGHTIGRISRRTDGQTDGWTELLDQYHTCIYSE